MRHPVGFLFEVDYAPSFADAVWRQLIAALDLAGPFPYHAHELWREAQIRVHKIGASRVQKALFYTAVQKALSYTMPYFPFTLPHLCVCRSMVRFAWRAAASGGRTAATTRRSCRASFG